MKAMKIYQLTEVIKKEHDQAIKKLDKGYSEYWFGRSTALGELLDILQKERVKPYKSCRLCLFDNEDCSKCF